MNEWDILSITWNLKRIKLEWVSHVWWWLCKKHCHRTLIFKQYQWWLKIKKETNSLINNKQIKKYSPTKEGIEMSSASLMVHLDKCCCQWGQSGCICRQMRTLFRCEPRFNRNMLFIIEFSNIIICRWCWVLDKCSIVCVEATLLISMSSWDVMARHHTWDIDV